MEFTFKGNVMKVGNSLVMNIPKPVVDCLLNKERRFNTIDRYRYWHLHSAFS